MTAAEKVGAVREALRAAGIRERPSMIRVPLPKDTVVVGVTTARGMPTLADLRAAIDAHPAIQARPYGAGDVIVVPRDVFEAVV